MLRDATLDLLKYSAFTELAAAVQAQIEVVLIRWQQVVRAKLPAVDRLTLEQLRDELPDVLHQLAETLRVDDGSGFEGLQLASAGHGRVRFHQSYDVNELMVEYGMLRPILLDEVVNHLGRPLTSEELAVLNMGMDTAVRKSVTQFTTFQQDQLKVVTEAQSKYLSFLSHDLRGGLNGVLLMVEVLKRELAGEPRFTESMEDLDAMRRSILDTVGTMDRFLHAERFRQGKVQPRNTTVDLRLLLSDLGAQFAHTAREKGLTVRVDVPAGLSVTSDKDLLLLILQNLLSNAIKYTPKGEVCLCGEPAGSGVSLCVIDQGPGIADGRLQHLFESFTRGDTHGQPGVGLGLSIAKQAAELIGGTLRAESTVGVGSTFTLELP